MTVIIICILLTLGYCLLMAVYWLGWRSEPVFTLAPSYEPTTFISVIIPARNEGRNIAACIESLIAQRYPLDLFEVIVVDDYSDDDTATIVRDYAGQNVRCISLADEQNAGAITVAYKKAAIAAGITHSKGSLIVTTDADCMAPNSWLLHLAAIYERDSPVMIVAPVIYSSNFTTVQLFQLIDFMSMQGITCAAHNRKLGNMSNGANLAFSKAAYESAGGYAGTTHLASGDDLLLMVKLNKQNPNRIAYLKSQHAIVRTAPQPDWGSFLQQRIRWASKSGKYNDARLTAILIFVYLFNLSFLVLSLAGIMHPELFYIVGGMLAAKIIAEYIFLVPVSRFFGERWVLRYFFFLQPLHILYIVAAGFLGFVGGYKWKGRKVR